MKKLATVLALMGATLFLDPTATATAYAQQNGDCQRGVVTQHDMAGFYQSDTMALSIYPCGGSFIEWSNQYGDHYATYVTTSRMPDGVVARTHERTPIGLDGGVAIGYKAAEPGYIQVVTSTPEFGPRIYKLRKMY